MELLYFYTISKSGCLNQVLLYPVLLIQKMFLSISCFDMILCVLKKLLKNLLELIEDLV